MNELLSLDALTKKAYDAKAWLTFYQNTWLRHVLANTVDVAMDNKFKAEDPEQLVIDQETGQQMPVKERLELRKGRLENALNIYNTCTTLLALQTDASVSLDSILGEKYWSEEALKIDETALAPEPKVGNVCKLPNGTDGVYIELGGNIVCAEKVADKEAESITKKPEAPAGGEIDAGAKV